MKKLAGLVQRREMKSGLVHVEVLLHSALA